MDGYVGLMDEDADYTQRSQTVAFMRTLVRS